tara:strand:+ start:4554 stop:4763 length:210 start_codon:yes stop_codon:yes gene_type:complete
LSQIIFQFFFNSVFQSTILVVPCLHAPAASEVPKQRQSASIMLFLFGKKNASIGVTIFLKMGAKAKSEI